MKNKICIALAFIGLASIIAAVWTMDFYLLELVIDFPNYLYWMMFGGMSMLIPAFICGIWEGDK